MRTLKKTLALVLALVMVLGFGAFASAVEFTDATEIENTEAVEVLTAAGIINGYPEADGTYTFRPEGTLTRAEAAVMLTRMLGATDLGGKAPFTDLEGFEWAEKAIAFCAAEGIVEGFDGKFDPNGQLTGYAWAKMLLGAIGYDAKLESMTGDSWEIGVGKLAKATQLFGTDVSDKTLPVSRDTACKWALTAMDITMVDYQQTSSDIVIGDVSIAGNKVIYSLNTDMMAGLGLVKNAVTIGDDGLNAHTWSMGTPAKVVAGPYVDDVLVATFPAGTTYKAIVTALGITAASTDTADYVVNGIQKATLTLKDYIADTTKIPAGATLAVYKNAKAAVAGQDDYVFAVTVSYLAKATVTKNTGDYKAYDDVTFTVYAASNYNVSFDETAKIPTGTYTNNAYYVVVPQGDNSGATKMLSVVAPTTVEGKITGTGSGFVRIGETKYTTTTWTEALDVADYNTNVFVGYLNAAGELLGYVKKTNAPVVAVYDGTLYMTAIEGKLTGAATSLFGDTAYSASAKAKVFFAGEAEAKTIDLAIYTKYNTDGTVAGTYVGKDENGNAMTKEGTTVSIASMGAGWYNYNVTEAGYVLTAIADSKAADVTLQANNVAVVANKFADADTVVTVYNYDSVAKNVTKTSYTGVAGYPTTAKTYADASAVIVVTYAKNTSNEDTNLVKTVDIYTTVASSVTTPVNYARFKAAGEQYAAGKYYQGFYVGGEYVEYKLAADYASGTLTENAVYNITLNAKGELQAVSTEGITMINNCTVNYVGSGYVVLTNGTTPYYLTSTCAIYNVATGHAGEVDTLTVGDKISIDLVDTGVDQGKVAVIYITTEATVV